jgi:hypothetical protein
MRVSEVRGRQRAWATSVRIVLAVSVASAAFGPVVSGTQGDARVVSASIDVQRKIVPAVLVSITNRYRRPIVSIDLSAPPTSAGFRFSEHQSGAAPVANSTILFGETRTLTVRVPAPASRATVDAVRFEDGRTEGAGSPVTSVAVSSAPGTATDVVVTLHNLRTAPVRAWQIVEYDSKPAVTPFARSGQARYLCATSLDGLIAGGEAREIRWNSLENYPGEMLPSLVLTGALWEDGRAEGSTKAVDDLQKLKAQNHCR